MAHNGHAALRGLLRELHRAGPPGVPGVRGRSKPHSQFIDAEHAIGSAARLPAGPAARDGRRPGQLVQGQRGSDIYDFVTDQFTIEKSDFNTGSFAAELGFSVTPRLDIIGRHGFQRHEHSRPTIATEEDNCRTESLPIQQITELEQMNLSASAKFSLLPRGRSDQPPGVDPEHVCPVCRRRRRLRQIQLPPERRFRRLRRSPHLHRHVPSEGWTPTFHVLGGTDIQVYAPPDAVVRSAILVAARRPGQDFIDFEPIDLGGFRFGAGIHFAF